VVFWKHAITEQLQDASTATADWTGSRLWQSGQAGNHALAADTARSPRRKELGLILCRDSLPAVCAYLEALQRDDAVFLLDAGISDVLIEGVLRAYDPAWIVQPDDRATWKSYRCEQTVAGWSYCRRTHLSDYAIHPDLAVLLSTSGSTGSPKAVRLSYPNLQANAQSIAEYLELKPSDRAITTLPFSYSYGLSVINSHLLAGASVVLTDAGLTSREFWTQFQTHAVTSFAGVPFTYQMLQRLNPEKLPLDSLDTLTQAGGKLSPALTEYFCGLAERRGWRFFVMYGQTEATARISYVPPPALSAKIGSIGIPIPGGRMSIAADGELVYEGPNVMMGYAEGKHDLGKGDELHGILHTGDLASQDADGYFFLQGRLKRFVKVHGNRVALDALESALEDAIHAPFAVTGIDEKIAIHTLMHVSEDAVRQTIRDLFGFHGSTYSITFMPELPMTASGKKDYGRLQS
jgi:long-chain acyl-CoA synthetase